MHLRQIKLAGFKSFVDPTQIEVPGSLVGVVGPNGCGKSNVIDAVRWVLGESKAAELRGESMQDVIFSGSVNRKPGGRASVELVFDNSDGRVQGEWGRFGEIAVKRVLTRDGASSYYINNQSVRRRDVQDIFLGTGLGPRAYAIIGQGMISRIIEARPEELRVFLEEAAGVSKYRERRRETENRLHDTRDNLTRVEDILRELEAQIEKLESQAEVAQRYQQLKASHDEQQRLLWMTRKRDAAAEQDKVGRDIEVRSAALEAHLAELRAAERRLDEARNAHYAGSDALHAAQSEVLSVNAEIGKLEAELRLVAESRERLASQVATLAATRERRLAEESDLNARAEDLQRQIGEGEARFAQATETLAEHDRRLPPLEAAYAAARDALGAARASAALAEQAIEGAGAEQRSVDRQLAALTQRRERLQEERDHLGAPDEERLSTMRAQAQRLEEELAASGERQQEAQGRLVNAQGQRHELLEARTRETETLARLEARLQALRELQANVEADEKLDPWLKAQGLDALPRLFRRLQVDAGWEVAFEAVLRDRIEGIEVGRLDSLAALAADAPPARVAFYSTAGAIGRETAALAGFGRLSDRVRGHDAALAAVLGDWLGGVFVADDLAQAMASREQLPPGGQFAVRDGHLVSRYGLRFYAPDDRKSGLLARRQEIENLEKEQRAQKLLLEHAVGALARCEAELREATAAEQAQGSAVQRLRGEAHARQLEIVRLAELVERVRHRGGQIETELTEVDAQESELHGQRADAERRFAELDQALAEKQQALESARVAYEDADRALRDGRDERGRLAAEAQRLEYEAGAARQRRSDVLHAIDSAREDGQRLLADQQAAQAQLAGLDDTAARTGLDGWLSKRAQAEDRLREARSRLDELGQQVRGIDEERLQLERDLQPRRDKITELQLKEQAARLAVEQFAQMLADVHADEAQLAERLQAAPVRAAALQAEIARLAAEVESLGAVNLAALQELESGRERKGFLDAQSADLKAAIDTLEDAIRRIDRETRELLQATFDQVNVHFGQLFPRLFGGGEARLLMTGEEILDAGVQVMAQPPGKRNSTIHLLSGGEKALTAIALVFALFKLNPAPFCLLDEVDAPLDDPNTERFCALVRSMTSRESTPGTQFLFITHNKITMEMAEQLIGVTMQEQGVSRIVAVDVDSAMRLSAEAA
ncbi:MAG: chromosome segregation protein SMC [Burkholderiales bacterium]|nr:MAG: chromosome segregation protein SMC [Burkholderiales bacterium]